jgi:hypothetical protein
MTEWSNYQMEAGYGMSATRTLAWPIHRPT